MSTKVNIELRLLHFITCPECGESDSAPFNYDNPGQEMKYSCKECDASLTVTFDEARAKKEWEDEYE